MAAVTALSNALAFCKANFETEAECHVIMQVTCELTLCPNPVVAAAAIECLVRISTMYYRLMVPYMAPALFGVSCVHDLRGSS